LSPQVVQGESDVLSDGVTVFTRSGETTYSSLQSERGYLHHLRQAVSHWEQGVEEAGGAGKPSGKTGTNKGKKSASMWGKCCLS